MPEPDVGECIKQYRLLRDKKDAMEKEHKDATRPYTEAMDSISGHLMSLMEAQGVTSFKSEHGTAFQKTTMGVKTEDKDALMRFVQDTGSFDLLTAGVSKEVLQVYLDEHNDTPPPGVTVRFFTEVQVRKPS